MLTPGPAPQAGGGVGGLPRVLHPRGGGVPRGPRLPCRPHLCHRLVNIYSKMSPSKYPFLESVPDQPQFVFWFHNDRMINYDKERGIQVYCGLLVFIQETQDQRER